MFDLAIALGTSHKRFVDFLGIDHIPELRIWHI